MKNKEYKEYKARIIRTIDGDTAEAEIDMGFGILYKSKLRFLDYDAPETFRPCCEAERVAGTAAKVYLRNRLKLNPEVILRTYKDKKGKYGRILCRILINGEDIIESMKSLNMVKLEEWK